MTKSVIVIIINLHSIYYILLNGYARYYIVSRDRYIVFIIYIVLLLQQLEAEYLRESDLAIDFWRQQDNRADQ